MPMYVDAKALSTVTGIPAGTLAKYRRTAAGPPYIKIGKRVRYNREKALAWIESRERRSTRQHTA
jgi:hypothetical protein